MVWCSSYLAGGDELQRPEGGAHVRNVGLELVESGRDAGLDLGRLGARRRVEGDLVHGLLRHGGGWVIDIAGVDCRPGEQKVTRRPSVDFESSRCGSADFPVGRKLGMCTT